MPGVRQIAAIYGTQVDAPRIDRRIANLASSQHGRISHRQLIELGLSARAIRSRVAAGRLLPVHRGVYAVGHYAISREGEWMGAVLAYGHACLSHRSGSEHLALLPWRPHPIDVSVPRRSAASRDGICVHRTTTLLRRDVIVRDGITVTTVARTLLDIAETVSRAEFEEAVEQAAIRRQLNLAAIEDVLKRAGGRRGQRLLRAAVRDLHPLTRQTKSKLERGFLRMLALAGLPQPLVNQPLTLPDGTRIKPDFHWPEHRLILETDGKETHLTPQAFERDRRRDQQLVLMGFRCPRTTWLQLEAEPKTVVEVVAGLIDPGA